MRRTGKMRRKKQKKIIIISALSLLLMITVGYAAFQTNLSITAKGNVKEKSRIIQAWDANSQTDFHSDYYKQNIVSATFLDNNNVPSNATESWNVSEDKENGGVMAWVIPNNEDNSKYDLYIGAKGGVIANEDSGYLFYNFINVNFIDFNGNFDTSNTYNMSNMFQDCLSLVTLDVSSINTHNVTDMMNMFGISEKNYSKSKLKQIIGLENFDTGNVINMQGMFVRNSSLTELDLSNWNTSNVTNMSWMFQQCTSLINLNLSNFDTRKLEKMRGMFQSVGLETINLCSFDTNNVTDMQLLFQLTPNVNKIYVGSKWTTSNADTYNIFDHSNVSSVTTGQC